MQSTAQCDIIWRKRFHVTFLRAKDPSFVIGEVNVVFLLDKADFAVDGNVALIFDRAEFANVLVFSAEDLNT